MKLGNDAKLLIAVGIFAAIAFAASAHFVSIKFVDRVPDKAGVHAPTQPLNHSRSAH